GEQRFFHFEQRRFVKSVTDEKRYLACLNCIAKVVDHTQHRRHAHVNLSLRLKFLRITVGRNTHVHWQIEFCRNFKSESRSNSLRERFVYLGKQSQHTFTNRWCFHFSQFKAQSFHDVVLLSFGLAVEKHRRLTEVIEKARTSFANFPCVNPFGIAGKSAHIHAGLKRTTATQTIRVIACLPAIDCLSHEPVAIVVVNRRHRAVDGNFVKVRPAKSRQLRIEIGKQTSLKQWIVGEVNSRNDVADVKGDLFSFCKEVVRVAV